MKHQNRLAHETSPYLLQHAHNPVEWYPWGPEALARAEAEDKPILLSIGYAACHWCHVMERESFENEATAAIMNEHFVCVKVDREERPDLDEIYMAATVAMSGSGGWPMTVFLTPNDHKPFFAGTYFPPDNRYGRPGFPTLLGRIAELWKRDRDTLTTQANDLAEQLTERALAERPAAVDEAAIEAAVSQFARAFDPAYGGFSSAPKFPPSGGLELLLRHHRRTGDEKALVMVRTTLDGMARGGMYDQLGGGFARYSTDERWLVPHFEKMLYDNALLARVYAEAYQVTGEADYARIARETLDYIVREMTSEEGGFYSATDADSEGVEGKFFVWTPDEIEGVLPADQAKAFSAYYDVTHEGNWEGNSILHTPNPDPKEHAALAPARDKLYAARKERVPPLLDDKILTAWNALMIGTMAEVGRILDEPRYRAAAARAADYLLEKMRRADGGLFRTARGSIGRGGKAHLDAYLEDYAYLADALIDVYEAGSGERYLKEAAALADRMIADFADQEHGGFFATAHGHEKLLVRMREGQDGAIPAANAIAARALTRLSWHLGKEELRERAVAAIRAHGKVMERAPRAFAASLSVVDMLLEGPVEAVLAGEDTATLAAELARHYLPNRIIVHPGAALAPAELVAGKGPIDGQAALYVCRSFVCQRPVTRTADVAAALGVEQGKGLEGRARRLGKRIAGGATAEGTRRYAARFKDKLGEGAYTELGGTGLVAGRIGFGGYRVDDDTPLFAEALRAALQGGCNLIDTSTNYTDGGSERLIGSIIAELPRDEIIVVSKIGYVQGKNLELARERKRAGRPFAEMVEYAEGCWHCIHPDFLADQLERSLDRLGVERLDVCLLHNPEYFLSHAAAHGGVDEAVRTQFYDRIGRALAYLETQRAAGRIGAYGISSNTVAQDAGEDPEATDLARLLAAHPFHVLQLPFNLLESAPALAPRIAGTTVLEHAAAEGIAVLCNRPLNAIHEDGMVRLADAPALSRPPRTFAEQLPRLRALEERFGRDLAGAAGGQNPFALADDLARLDGRITTLEQFEQLARGQVLPHVGRALGMVERAVGSRDAWQAWRKAYIEELEHTLAALRAQTLESAAARAKEIAARIDPLIPLARHGETLQRKALWTLTSTLRRSVVLLGMRQPAYVKDALAVMSWPRLERARAVLEALR